MHWMILPFKRFFDFKGRSRRMEFWMFALLNAIVYIVIGALMFTSGSMMDQLAATDANDVIGIYSTMFSGWGILFVIWGLVVLIPSIFVSVRRLHDRDLSGWWYLAFIVLSMIPFVGILASLAYLVVMLLPGTDGPNRFGPDPKNPTSADVFE